MRKKKENIEVEEQILTHKEIEVEKIDEILTTNINECADLQKQGYQVIEQIAIGNKLEYKLKRVSCGSIPQGGSVPDRSL